MRWTNRKSWSADLFFVVKRKAHVLAISYLSKCPETRSTILRFLLSHSGKSPKILKSIKTPSNYGSFAKYWKILSPPSVIVHCTKMIFNNTSSLRLVWPRHPENAKNRHIAACKSKSEKVKVHYSGILMQSALSKRVTPPPDKLITSRLMYFHWCLIWSAVVDAIISTSVRGFVRLAVRKKDIFQEDIVTRVSTGHDRSRLLLLVLLGSLTVAVVGAALGLFLMLRLEYMKMQE